MSRGLSRGVGRVMIAFDLPDACFTYRVAAVALHDGHVLLHRAECDDFWALPGGRCEAMEHSTDAILREMREEYGETVRVERLLWVVENFFTHAGKPYHELGLYYLVALTPGSPLLDTRTVCGGQEGDLPLIFQWFPLDAVERTRIYPVFLRTALQSIPDTIEHVVNHDRQDDDGLL